MARQERAARAKKKGTAKAEKIIAEAKAKVMTKSDYEAERKQGANDEEFALACKVRQLRDEGEAWWAIAKALDMEGAGDSATTGKKGASRARSAYAKGFGSFPRTFSTGRTPAEKNERVRDLQKAKKADRIKRAKEGKSVIGKKVPDEDVAAMLKGRRIQWWVQSELIPDGTSMEAAVHPHSPLYIIGEGKDRVVEFREEHRRAPVDVRWHPAQIRTVRLSSIYSIR